jgi:oligopeptide/dipeptide ABC transporter ATP-binding protein
LILYAGRIVEQGTPEELFNHPRHPYTEGLLAALPEFSHKGQKLFSIGGAVPSPFDSPKGCIFAPRCPKAREKCRLEDPPLEEAGKGHGYRCFYPSEK